MPSRAVMAAASRSEVRGPVAMIPASGSSVASSRTILIRGCDWIRSSTSRAKTSRSTASAVPPGTRASSAQGRSMLPRRRSSALSRPCAVEVSTDLKVLLHTSSASRPVWCAAVPVTGRISCSVTSTPRSASAHAASLPARPPPMTAAFTPATPPPARPRGSCCRTSCR